MLDDFRLQFLTSTVDGLRLGAIFALVALGYTLVYRVLRLINFAHSEIFMIGVFAALFAMHGLGISTTDPAITGVALVVTLVAVILSAALASSAAALVLELGAERSLQRP